MLPNLGLRLVFEHLLKPDTDGQHTLETFRMWESLRNTCVQFREVIEFMDTQNIKVIKIENIENDLVGAGPSGKSKWRDYRFDTKRDMQDYYKTLRRMIHSDFVNPQLVSFELNLSKIEETRVVEQISNDLGVAVLMVGTTRSKFRGKNVRHLRVMISRPGLRSITSFAGENDDGKAFVYVLQADEFIVSINWVQEPHMLITFAPYFVPSTDDYRLYELSLITNKRRLKPLGDATLAPSGKGYKYEMLLEEIPMCGPFSNI